MGTPELPVSVRRLMDQLADSPVAVYDACWTLIEANPPYAALMGDPSPWRGHRRNRVWRHFLGPRSRVRYLPQDLRALEVALVGDLRAAAEDDPADPRLQGLIADLRAESGRFAELWDAGVTGVAEPDRATIDHPLVGSVTLACDVLAVADSDLRVLLYTAQPATEDADRLALLTVLGTEEIGSGSFPE